MYIGGNLRPLLLTDLKLSVLFANAEYCPCSVRLLAIRLTVRRGVTTTVAASQEWPQLIKRPKIIDEVQPRLHGSFRTNDIRYALHFRTL